MAFECHKCHVQACKQPPETRKLPKFCPMELDPGLLCAVEQQYRDDEVVRTLAATGARVESAGYCHWPRVEEVMQFARRLGVRHLGVATCVGLIEESRILAEILGANGFEVSTVCCKVGAIEKEAVGLTDAEKIRPGQHESLCNPVGQARLLDRAGTGLNIALGLCVGHDSLFFRHSTAPVTVLVAKDRVTGHNPAAALYTSRSYYRRLRGG
jgi:uncharacterized metal-binding protein